MKSIAPKKQPEIVRRKLLECCAQLLIEHGVAGLPLHAVAQAAGVTKGGLLHHFPSKRHLIEAVYEDLLKVLDAEIDYAMSQDPIAFGRYTRAYLGTVFLPFKPANEQLWAALASSTLTDSELRVRWAEWNNARLQRHQDTDSHSSLMIVRYAADGAWLDNLFTQDCPPSPEDRHNLYTALIKMTQEPGQ